MALYGEVHRPRFHFSARENWHNDPNGLVYYDGTWHLFFQHNPTATVWGNMTWGHATSDDLIHWRQLEHALHPDELGTMFSGSAVVDWRGTAGFGEEALLAFYTAAGDFVEPAQAYTQCIAYSTDGGASWHKHAQNPIVPCIEGANRDPKVIWHAATNQWIMALYLGDDRYCLLRSEDTRTWARFQDLKLEGERECPDFFPLVDEAGEERWVFWGAGGTYRIGAFDGVRFEPATDVLRCEHGPNGYAAQTWSDAPGGRRIQISWMAGGQYPEMPFNQQMSFPVELGLRGAGSDARLQRWPVAEIHGLRQSQVALARQRVSAGTRWSPNTEGELFDLSFSLRADDGCAVLLLIRGQPLTFDFGARVLQFRRREVPMPPGDPLPVRLLIDRTSVEVFLTGGQTSASFCFLPDAYVRPLVFQAKGGEAELEDLSVHELTCIWSAT